MNTAQEYNKNSIVDSIKNLGEYSIEPDSVYLQTSIAQSKMQSLTILQRDSNATFFMLTNQILNMYTSVFNADRLGLSTSMQFTTENRYQ